MKPLYDALLEYARGARAVFHMPGHKLGRGFIRPGAFTAQGDIIQPGAITMQGDITQSDAFSMQGDFTQPGGFMPPGVFDRPALFDVTELDETDDLHSPHGPLLEAQRLAAGAFGAGRTWFLVNGSSCGIFAMIAANCAAGQKLLIARDFHYSAYNAMRFARTRPVFMNIGGGADGITGPGAILNPSGVERALYEHPDASALYLTRPGYYGDVCDIAEITRLAHKRGVTVLVDEAHGAHLAFLDRLPASALAGGADFCVQSAHKTLPAFTQCAYAHISDKKLAGDPSAAGRLSEALVAFQTSSPSFLLTASLDYAREYMQANGAKELDRIAGNCERFYMRMAAAGFGVPQLYASLPAATPTDTPALSVRQPALASCDATTRINRQSAPPNAAPSRYGRDITRLVLSTRPLGLSGVETGRLLWSRYGIGIETSDPSHIVMITGVADKDGDFALLADALEQIAASQMQKGAPASGHSADIASVIETSMDGVIYGDKSAAHRQHRLESTSACEGGRAETALTGGDYDFITSLHEKKARAPLHMAEGRAAAEMVTPYPPGIPLLCPGETVTSGVIGEIRRLLDSGVMVKGIGADGEIAVKP